jgi:ABC-type glycerol-3-phosphate transport system permease component
MRYKRALHSSPIHILPIFRAGILISVLLLFSFTLTFPYIWALSTSFKPPRTILSVPPKLIPTPFTVEHYLRLVNDNIFIYFFNSLFNSLFSVFFTLLLASFAGYSLSRFRFRGRNLFMIIVIVNMAIPLLSTLLPLFFIFSKLGLVNQRFTLPVVYVAHRLPLATWIMLNFFQTVPRSLEESAYIDGLSRFKSIFYILIPLSKPGLLTAGLFTFLFSWNDYLGAVFLTSSIQFRTLPVAMHSYLGYYGREWGPLCGAGIVAIIPVIVLYALFRNYLLGAYISGSVKG